MTPITVTTTREAAQLHGVKICVHGRAGAGKTTLVATLPTPILISAESGVLSLGHLDIPQITIDSYAGLDEVYQWLAYSQESWQYQSVALDSISEIAEQCLAAEMVKSKDGRRAYGEMATEMRRIIRLFRDLPGRHVYFSAKQAGFADDIGVTRYAPSMPGKSLTGDIPYFFDELFSLEVGKDAEGREYRYLRTRLDLQHEAKDRSGALDEFEPPDLGQVIQKIQARHAATHPTGG